MLSPTLRNESVCSSAFSGKFDTHCHVLKQALNLAAKHAITDALALRFSDDEGGGIGGGLGGGAGGGLHFMNQSVT